MVRVMLIQLSLQRICTNTFGQSGVLLETVHFCKNIVYKRSITIITVTQSIVKGTALQAWTRMCDGGCLVQPSEFDSFGTGFRFLGKFPKEDFPVPALPSIAGEGS